MRNIDKTAIEAEHARDIVLDRIAGRVRLHHEVAFAIERAGPAELGEGKRSDNIRTVEQLRVIADLAKLHDEVRERAFILGFVDRWALGNKVCNRDVLEQRSIHLPLASAQLDQDVDLDLT